MHGSGSHDSSAVKLWVFELSLLCCSYFSPAETRLLHSIGGVTGFLPQLPVRKRRPNDDTRCFFLLLSVHKLQLFALQRRITMHAKST